MSRYGIERIVKYSETHTNITDECDVKKSRELETTEILKPCKREENRGTCENIDIVEVYAEIGNYKAENWTGGGKIADEIIKAHIELITPTVTKIPNNFHNNDVMPT